MNRDNYDKELLNTLKRISVSLEGIRRILASNDEQEVENDEKEEK